MERRGSIKPKNDLSQGNPSQRQGFMQVTFLPAHFLVDTWMLTHVHTSQLTCIL